MNILETTMFFVWWIMLEDSDFKLTKSSKERLFCSNVNQYKFLQKNYIIYIKLAVPQN